jgi:hypothetical protein
MEKLKLPSKDEEEMYSNEIIESDNYIGNWKRVGMFVNDQELPSIQCILVLRDNFFKKMTDCELSGELNVSDDLMAMKTLEDGCGEEKKTYITYYMLSEDKNELTLIIKDSSYEIKDVYQRINK